MPGRRSRARGSPQSSRDSILKMRLICFPYAGGSAAIYHDLPRLLPHMDVRAIELPGRGSRWRERPHDSLDRLVESLLDEFAALFAAPFACLGHSMGAAISFELALRLPEPLRANLRHLFLSGRAARGLSSWRPLHVLDDVAFRQELRSWNSPRSSALDNDELMQLMMPALRADFTLIERYSPPTDRRVAVGITAFAGTQDERAPVASVAAWREATSRDFNLHLVEGGHFFLEPAMPFVASVIASRLSAPS